MTIKQIDIAIVGAASLAGEAVLSLLAERKFPLATLYAVDVVEQAGSHVEYKDEPVPIHELAEFDFEKVQLAIFLVSAALAAEYAPQAAEAGCIVIDTSIAFRYEPDIPLIVPGVNDELIANYRERMILNNPASAASQLLKTIKPIDNAVGIEELNVTVMQSVSQLGKAGQEELGRQTAQLLNFQDIQKEVFASQIAFNLIPQSGIVVEGGHTSDELDLIRTTHKALNNDKISMQATVVIVPVFYGTTESVVIKTRQGIGADKVVELLDNVPGLRVTKTTNKAPITPVSDASGVDEVIIGRIRSGISGDECELSLLSVADDICAGVALNSVQTAEILVKDYL